MSQNASLPLLPGYSFNRNIGQTRFHKSQLFEHLMNIPIITDKLKPGIGGALLPDQRPAKYPSIYTRGEVTDLPAWLLFDKQVLCFEAFFQETAEERQGYNYQIRRFKIYFYLEDGTVVITEPKVADSGIPQGTLLSRQRIPFPTPRNNEFYDIVDFNIGRTVDIYGRTMMITNCDKFTRNFLNRLGIPVPDPVNVPPDPYITERQEGRTLLAKKPNRTVDTRGQFLEYDGKVLRFYGYWDDRDTLYGFLHRLEVLYYLSDDTMEIKDVIPPNSGRDSGFSFIKRAKLSKNFPGLPMIGSGGLYTVLNVLSSSAGKERFIADSLNCGSNKVAYYRDEDLAIGAVIDVYGRKIMLTDCDPFTKEFYRKKYGLDDFLPVEQPTAVEETCASKSDPRPLPPYNGFGTYEDSAGNCRTVTPKAPQRDFIKFLLKDRIGLDSHILRFQAKLISRVPQNAYRTFLVSYILCDDTIHVFENARLNTGFTGGMFFSRCKMAKPGQDVFTSEPPVTYNVQDFYIGNQLVLNSFTFLLTDADEYALRYMEVNCTEFPKSDINLILNKVREALRPIYKDFVCDYLKSNPTQEGFVCFKAMKKALKKVLGDDITEHEIITIARKYKARCDKDRHTREEMRVIVHQELKRLLYDSLERFEEDLKQRDEKKCGFLPREVLYAACRANRLPLDRELVLAVLGKLNKDKCGGLDYMDLLSFLDYKKTYLTPVAPFNIVREYAEISEPCQDNSVGRVDYNCLLKDLDLEKTVMDQS